MKPLFRFTEAPASRCKPGLIPTKLCPFLRHIFIDNSHYEFLEGPIVFTDWSLLIFSQSALDHWLILLGISCFIFRERCVSTTTIAWLDSPGVTDTSLTKSGLFMQNRFRTEFSLVGWCCIWCKWFSSRISRSFSFMPLLGTPLGIIWSSQLILGTLKSPPMIRVHLSVSWLSHIWLRTVSSSSTCCILSSPCLLGVW